MKRIHWPTAIVLVVVVVVLAAAYLFGPMLGVPVGSHEALVAGVGAVGALVLAYMRGVLSRDEDHDGVPDALQKPKPPPSNEGAGS